MFAKSNRDFYISRKFRCRLCANVHLIARRLLSFSFHARSNRTFSLFAFKNQFLRALSQSTLYRNTVCRVLCSFIRCSHSLRSSYNIHAPRSRQKSFFPLFQQKRFFPLFQQKWFFPPFKQKWFLSRSAEMIRGSSSPVSVHPKFRLVSGSFHTRFLLSFTKHRFERPRLSVKFTDRSGNSRESRRLFYPFRVPLLLSTTFQTEVFVAFDRRFLNLNVRNHSSTNLLRADIFRSTIRVCDFI